MRRTPCAVLVSLALVTLTACGPSKPKDPRDLEIEKALAKHPEAAKTRVLILGLDSADLDIIEPLVAKGELPAFARLMREGAYGKLRSQAPLLSPIIWTTIATGKPMDEHGVLDFVVEDPKTGRTLPVSSYQRKVEAIWDIVGRFGLKVGVVGWLASWPAQKVNGFVVSERVGLLGYEYGRREDDPRAGKTWPEDLYDRIEPDVRKVGDITYEDVARFLHIPESEFRASYERKPDPKNRVNNFRLYLATAETFRKVGLSLWKEEEPRLMAWYFEFLDATSHLFMPYAPPRQPQISEQDFARYKDAVEETYRYADRQLAEAMAAVDENTVLLVLSDHGFRSGSLRLRKGSEFHDRAAAMWHRMFGTFMAWGKGVKRGVKVRSATIFDIAPTVLGLLGFPKAADMPGHFLTDAFDVTPPAEEVDTYERGGRKGLPRAGESPEDDIQLQKLQALGYLGADPTVSSQVNLGTFYSSRGEYEKALEAYQKALLKQPSNARIHLAIGEAYGKLRKVKQAEESLLAAKKLDPEMIPARLNLGRLYWMTGRYEKAGKEFAEIVAKEPRHAPTWVEIGRMWLRRKNSAKAIEAFGKAVEAEPDYVDARAQLGLVLTIAGRYDEAEKHLRVAVDLDPGRRKAWNNIGVCQMRRASRIEDPQAREEMFDKALETFDMMVKRFPKYAKAYGNRAKIRLLREQFELARRDAEKAVELDSRYETAREILKDPRLR